jgi:hypothetical protein
MDKAKIAEWILALAMEPAQAASVVGDLLETGTARSMSWFWSNVFQTLAATAWRDAKIQPLFIVSLAIRGVLMECSFSLLAMLVASIGDVAFAGMFLHGHPTQDPLWLFTTRPVPVFVVSYFAGQWIAQRSSGKEITACLAMVTMEPLVFRAIVALMWLALPPGAFHHVRFTSGLWNWWEIVSVMSCLMGAAAVRRRRHRQSRFPTVR